MRSGAAGQPTRPTSRPAPRPDPSGARIGEAVAGHTRDRSVERRNLPRHRRGYCQAVEALRLVTVAEEPALAAEMLRLGASPWPEFLDHDAVVNELWRLIYELAPGYQFALLDEHADSVAAVGNCIPI